jgi:hypothetical protein
MVSWRTSDLFAHLVRQVGLSMGSLAVLSVTILAGCGTADPEHSPAAGAGEDPLRMLAPVSMAQGEAGASAGSCPSGVVRECKTVLARHGDVANCFVGVQLCSDEAWGPCQSPDEL